MGAWTVVVWAVVAPDLRQAFEADLREARTAIAAAHEAGVHVHVVATGHTVAGRSTWSTPDQAENPNDFRFVPTPGEDPDLEEVLGSTACWTDDRDDHRNRLLVLWGHGARAFATKSGVPDVPTSDRLEAVRALTSHPPDIIGYDACQMASVETVLPLAERFGASMFVGSMMPEPASGWPYVELLRILAAGWSKEATAAAIVQAYASSVDVDDWCLLALDLAKIGGDEGLAARLARLDDPARVPAAIDFFDAAHGADILTDTNLADLGALMRRLDLQGKNQPARDVVTALREATTARRSAGALADRDGLAIVVGTPWERSRPWPSTPGWPDYLPVLAPAGR